MHEIAQFGAQPSPPMQEHRPEVSVVIVCYNQAVYLLDAIKSVLAQTYRDFEVVLVDDGSTDNTAERARSVPEICYVYQNNQGLAAARNAGLALSRGRYVVFLDADDRLLPNALESGIASFREHPTSGFVYGNFRKLFNDETTLPAFPTTEFSQDHYRHFLQQNLISMHATVMYSREVLNAVGGFNKELRACEDYDIYLRIARGWEVNQHPAFVAEYRQHATNMSRDNAFMLRWSLRVLRMQQPYLRSREDRLALRRGLRAWKRYYAECEFGEGNKSAPERIGGLLTLMRWYPLGVSKRALKFLNDRITGRKIRLGSLRRLTPFSRQFGFDRGQPVDRRYIESFLGAFSVSIQGQVLEIGDDSYSQRFGCNRITEQHVLHVSEGHPGATITADLTDAPQIPSDRFDCVILTQTLHMIFDTRAALATLYRILKPGGVLLATLPGISQICHDKTYPETDSWRFTTYSAQRLFTEYFPENCVHVRTYGNVLAATAFLYGLATQELRPNELDYPDPDYPVIIGVRAQKPQQFE
jgi:glycosyltransferase involved in cell wall biosynthesis